MYNVDTIDGELVINGLDNFELAATLDCGQAFRWKTDDGIKWYGVAYNKYIELVIKNNQLIISGINEDDYNTIFKNYFDLNRDYSKIITEISADPILKKAASYGKGIRILNQDPWETLCSFIISQNNNIPRIKGIIDRLCENFGKKVDNFYTFPDPKDIACLSLKDLEILRSGFRAKYILDAAQKVANGDINLQSLKSVPTDEARETLMQIKGVGPKVADCVLLFSLEHIDAFPRDVWIKRAMTVLFNDKLPKSAEPYAGIVQQYIFYYARGTKLEI